MKQITICTHGTAKSNPGAAAIAIVVVDDSGKTLSKTVECIGNATDIYASFTAVARGLAIAAQEFDANTADMTFEVVLSNEEVKRLVNGEVPITHPGIVPHFIEIHNLRVSHFPNLTFTLLSKKENAEVHKLVEEALDGK